MTELEKILLEFEQFWTGEAKEFKATLFKAFVEKVLSLQGDVYGLAAGGDVLKASVNLDELFKLWADTSLTGDIESLFPNVESINKAVQSLHSDINNIKLSGNLIKGLTFAQRDVINQIGLAFKDVAYNKVLKQSLMAATEYGLSLKKFRSVVKNNLNRQDKNIQARFNQITNDAYSQHIGALNKVVEENYDIKGYLYAPLSVMDNTRPLCKGAIRDYKGYISVAELPKFVSHYTSTKELSQGLLEGFNVDDFKMNTGKPNCRHTATPTVLNKEQISKFKKK